MFCYISFVIEGHDTKFLCELCEKEIQGPEILLKLHQIGLHLNPYYLSASDRILAQISSYAVHTEKTEVPWVPDWDTFKVSFINTKIRSDCLFMDRRLKRVLIGHVIRKSRFDWSRDKQITWPIKTLLITVLLLNKQTNERTRYDCLKYSSDILRRSQKLGKFSKFDITNYFLE